MQRNDRFSSLRHTNEALLAQGKKLILKSDYAGAESVFKQALDNWRANSAPKNEEGRLIIALGKSYEAQRKYELAYELYMESLNHLTGQTYDEVYSSFLYLNERMGTFTKKNPTDGP
jgi:tetratricopeptide (TPR) repeat protein